MPERDDLVLEHLQIVKNIAATMSRNQQEREQLEGDGYLGLVLAARDWNPDRGVPFRPYAILRVRGAMVDGIRTWTMPPGRRTVHDRATPGKDIPTSLDIPAVGDPLVAEGDPFEAVEDADVVRWALGRLRRSSRDLAVRYYLDGKLLKEIGKEEGVSVSMMSRRLKIVNRELRALAAEAA